MRAILNFQTSIFICLFYSVICCEFMQDCQIEEECVPWNECNDIITEAENIRDNIYSEEAREYLKSKRCGYESTTNKNYFCCRKNDSIPSYLWDVLNRKNLGLLCMINSDNCGKVLRDRMLRPNFGVSPTQDIPWKALILTAFNDIFCTGSVISNRYILTAASCFNRILDPKKLKVRFGDYDLRSDSNFEINVRGFNPYLWNDTESYAIEEIHLHPHFHNELLVNDIALIRTKQNIYFNEIVSPICLPLNRQEKIIPCWEIPEVHGWGISQLKTFNFNILQRMYADVVPNNECQEIYKNRRKIYESQMCLRPRNAEYMYKCVDDKGGIGSLERDESETQFGVASIPKEGCNLSLPTVYTKVSYYTKWILDTIK